MDKQLLNDIIEDLVSDLLYYDRKEDEEFTLKDVEDLLKNNKQEFKDTLIELFTLKIDKAINTED